MKIRLLLAMAAAFGWFWMIGCTGDQPQEPAAVPAHSKTAIVIVGAGGITDLDYATGGAIAKIVNRKKDLNGIRCTVEPTDGSVYNLTAVLSGDLQFGMVRSDRQYQAWNGSPNSDWVEQGPQKDLRACFSLHPEPLILVTAEDAGIHNIHDLKGRHVNIGPPGSDQRRNAIDALEAVGLHYETDLQAEGVNAAESLGLLQDGRIDAFFSTAGNSSRFIPDAAAGKRKVRLAAIAGIEKLLGTHPYYTRAVIPVDRYPGVVNENDVETFAVRATLVTSIRVPDDIVYAVTREVFDNFEAFKSLHPAFRMLTPKGMLEGLSAPLHPGAEKYFKEVGLL